MKLKSITSLFVMIFCLVTTMSAQSVKGNGNLINSTRQVNNFNSIGVSGSFDVELRHGKEGKIEIEIEENLLPYLITEVDGKHLKIRWKRNARIRTKRGVHLVVHFKNLEDIGLSGSGDVVSRDPIKSETFSAAVSGSGDMELNVVAKSVSLAVSGSGDMELEGSCDEFSAAVSGSGDIDAIDLKAKNADVSVSGSGEMTVYASEKLKARVAGSGGVEYKGSPRIEDIKVSGSGNVSSY